MRRWFIINIIDREFKILTDEIKRLNEKEIYHRIRENFEKIPEETKQSCMNFFNQFNYWGKLDIANDIYEEIELKAKTLHENIDDYTGKNICFTGYVYRAIDFEETEFVLARDMIVNSETQTLVVGFLCNCKDAKKFADNSWVEITGEITKGDYHGDMPIIDVKEISQIEKPQNDIYVYPPDDTYIPTSAIF